MHFHKAQQQAQSTMVGKAKKDNTTMESKSFKRLIENLDKQSFDDRQMGRSLSNSGRTWRWRWVRGTNTTARHDWKLGADPDVKLEMSLVSPPALFQSETPQLQLTTSDICALSNSPTFITRTTTQ